VLALTGLASVMVGLDAFVVTTALPTIQVHLHASAQALEWTVNAYTLSFAVLLMTGAALGDRFGRRRMFSLGIGLFAAASASCALSPDMAALIASRAVQGGGAALVMPLAMALLTAAFAPADRPKALGTFGGITALAVVLGPLLGGAVVRGISWPWVFWINVPIAAILLGLIRGRIGEGFGPRARIDGPGVLLVTGGAFGIVWALVRGNAAGWGSAEVIASLAAGVLLAGGFVAWELRAAAPMMPMRLFRSRQFSAGIAAVFFQWASAFGTIYFLTQFLQDGLGNDPLGAGLRLIPWGVAPVLIARSVGRLVGRFGERPFILAGMTLIAAGNAAMALIADSRLAYWKLAAVLVCTGIGVALTIVAAQSAALTAIAPADIGKASGTFNTMRQLGGTFGVAVLAAVFASAGSYASTRTFVAGFAAAMGAAAGLAAAGALAGLVMPRRAALAAAQADRAGVIKEAHDPDRPSSSLMKLNISSSDAEPSLSITLVSGGAPFPVAASRWSHFARKAFIRTASLVLVRLSGFALDRTASSLSSSFSSESPDACVSAPRISCRIYSAADSGVG
jgi:EmrB/QacA subfamily drug resistance transporter